MSARHPIGVFGLQALYRWSGEGQDREQAVLAVTLRAWREGGLPAPLAPSRIAQVAAEAQAWLDAEVEAGRDFTGADIAAAGEYVRGITAQGLAPSAAAIPQPPSQS